MNSVVMKSIYAGLGLLGTGKESVEELGRKLARKASLSEKDGERIARELRRRSEKVIDSLQKTIASEVDMVARAIHTATGDAKAHRPKSSGAKKHTRASAKGAGRTTKTKKSAGGKR